jgi:hypothetical protein
MTRKCKTVLAGGGIGSLAAAAFMIRDGNGPGANRSDGGVRAIGGHKVSPVGPHAKSPDAPFDALIEAFK